MTVYEALGSAVLSFVVGRICERVVGGSGSHVVMAGIRELPAGVVPTTCVPELVW